MGVSLDIARAKELGSLECRPQKYQWYVRKLAAITAAFTRKMASLRTSGHYRTQEVHSTDATTR
eukprot:1926223-Amphidinium_carterae.1